MEILTLILICLLVAFFIVCMLFQPFMARLMGSPMAKAEEGWTCSAHFAGGSPTEVSQLYIILQNSQGYYAGDVWESQSPLTAYQGNPVTLKNSMQAGDSQIIGLNRLWLFKAHLTEGGALTTQYTIQFRSFNLRITVPDGWGGKNTDYKFSGGAMLCEVVYQ
jgi:hypothetical protein